MCENLSVEGVVQIEFEESGMDFRRGSNTEMFHMIKKPIQSFGNAPWASLAATQFFTVVKIVSCYEYRIFSSEVSQSLQNRRLPGTLAFSWKPGLVDGV